MCIRDSAHYDALERAFRNLVVNAVEAADGAPGRVEVTVRSTDGLVDVELRDHGPGIPRSDQERVFDKFTRLGDHLTRPQQGVGLGLYIARRSAEKLDGRLWVDSTPGGGSTFCFTMPMEAPRIVDPRSRRRRRTPISGTA